MVTGTPLRGAQMVVTGGGSGLGRELSLQAAARGAHPIVWDRDEHAAAGTAERIRQSGGTCDIDVVDVTDEAAVSAAVARTDRVDILVNNAGVVSGGSISENDSAQIRRTFEVNTLSHYWTTRAVLPGMRARNRGTVVAIASAAGLVGVARQTDYSASKHAVVGFMESLRAELRRAGRGCHVRTLLVCPYYIDTGMFDGVHTRFPHLLPILDPGDVARRILDRIESGRAELIMPMLARLVPAVRVLPTAAFDAVMDLFGINRTMDAFTGRIGTRQEEQ